MDRDICVAANVKAGAKAIKFHLDYMNWLLDNRRWLAGDEMSLADFAAAAQLSALDYICDVDWNRSARGERLVCHDEVAPGVPVDTRRYVPGFPPPHHYANLDF